MKLPIKHLAAKRTAEENELKCAQELDEVRAQLFFAQTALAAEKQMRAKAEYRLIWCAGQSAQHWYHKYEAAEQCLAQIEAENKQLREALAPFGCHPDKCEHSGPACDYDRAIRTLEPAAPQEGSKCCVDSTIAPQECKKYQQKKCGVEYE